MSSSSVLSASKSKDFLKNLVSILKAPSCTVLVRGYARRPGGDDSSCRRALVDIPKKPICPTCEKKSKKKGIMHTIKMKLIEGGTNFGTPFHLLRCDKKPEKKIVPVEPAKALPAPKKKVPLPVPADRPGVQVAILGADTAIGQYAALLLKQCPTIKKLRLYETTDTCCSECTRELGNVVEDLRHIDTNCLVQAFSCACDELPRCLQNSDIVLMLESSYVNVDMPFEKRFLYQAPMVKKYTDVIATECPHAFIIVGASPIDCMVPLVAETMKESGWYNPNKLLGSLAVPEMRASTLAARALSLEPRYTKVPCVGGTEGEALVPLFSKAVEYFDFHPCNAEMMTAAVRRAQETVTRAEGSCLRAADLSEAHALSHLVSKVALALLCKDIPRVSGFVETDSGQVVSPAKFLANPVELSSNGITKHLGLPKLSPAETEAIDLALIDLNCKMHFVMDWYKKYSSSGSQLHQFRTQFYGPRHYKNFDDCAYANM